MRHVALAALTFVATVGLAHAAQEPNGLPEVTARVKMTVGADGTPTNVKVTGATPDIGALVYKRATQWKFTPAQWQGKAVSATYDRWLDLDVLPTSTGGFALRMAGFSDQVFDAMERPARMEGDTYTSFRANVMFGYVVHLQADGRVQSVDAVLPKQHATQQTKAYAGKIESMLKAWRGNPRMVDGGPVACSRLYLEEHKSDLMGKPVGNEYAGWADEVNLDRFPADVAEAVENELAVLDATGTRCPAPLLQTKIDGEML
jgi:hypothetical protein